MLARENEMGTAEVLREWLANKDKDLREWEPSGGGDKSTAANGHGKDWKVSGTGPLDALKCLVRRRLHVKQLIDHALNTLKAHSHCDTHSHTLADTHWKRQNSSAEPASPLGEYIFYPTKLDSEANNNEVSPRRPSLLHIYGELPVPSSSTSRRPWLAGQDAEPEPLRVPARKLGSKYLLLNLFRKAGEMPNTGFSTPESPYNPSSSIYTPSTSPSPTPITIPLPTSPRLNLVHLSPSLPPELSPLGQGHHPQMASDMSLESSAPAAVEPHNSLAEDVRTRSGSVGGPDEEATAGGSGHHTPASKAGIPWTHNRTSSSGQSQIQAASFQALHFESSSSPSSLLLSAKA
jgi:hypothetical protein